MGLTGISDPWTVLSQSWPLVGIEFRQLPANVDGYTRWPYDGSPTLIVLCRSLDAVEVRCTLAHEIGHLELGSPAVPDSAPDERLVREATARWLLPDLGHVAQEVKAIGPWAAADELDVTYEVLRDRIVSLNAAEREIVWRLPGWESAA